VTKKAEERYTYGAAARRRKKNRRKYTFYYFIAAFLMLAVGAALALTVFFNITDITVVNESRYSDEEIIEAGGVVIGDNLLRLHSSEIKSDIIKEFPYIESVKLHRVFPTELQLEVSEASIAAAIERDERYLLISANGRVLEEISARPEGSPRIIGPEVKKLEEGDYLPEQESERLPALIKILELIGQNKLTGIDVIDLRDMRDIRMLYRGRVSIELGNIGDIEYKIKAICSIIEAAVNEETVGRMDVSSRDSMRLREMNIYQGENWKFPEYMLEDYRRQL